MVLSLDGAVNMAQYLEEASKVLSAKRKEKDMRHIPE
jgi:hypothetical protein